MGGQATQSTARVVAEGLSSILEAADGMGLPESRACEMAASYLREMRETFPGVVPDGEVPQRPARDDLETLIAHLKQRT